MKVQLGFTKELIDELPMSSDLSTSCIINRITVYFIAYLVMKMINDQLKWPKKCSQSHHKSLINKPGYAYILHGSDKQISIVTNSLNQLYNRLV